MQLDFVTDVGIADVGVVYTGILVCAAYVFDRWLIGARFPVLSNPAGRKK